MTHSQAILLGFAFVAWCFLLALHYLITPYARDEANRMAADGNNMIRAARGESLYMFSSAVWYSILPFAPTAFLAQFEHLAYLGLNDVAVRQFFFLCCLAGISVYFYLIRRFGREISQYWLERLRSEPPEN